MGIYSDVGIAISNKVEVTSYMKSFLGSADQVFPHERGTLYVFENIKWNPMSSDVEQFLKDIETLDDRQWLIAEACFDYPDPEAFQGQWADNPWDLGIQLSVNLTWREPSED